MAPLALNRLLAVLSLALASRTRDLHLMLGVKIVSFSIIVDLLFSGEPALFRAASPPYSTIAPQFASQIAPQNAPRRPPYFSRQPALFCLQISPLASSIS